MKKALKNCLSKFVVAKIKKRVINNQFCTHKNKSNNKTHLATFWVSIVTDQDIIYKDVLLLTQAAIWIHS